jgi:hypothetical protein
LRGGDYPGQVRKGNGSECDLSSVSVVGPTLQTEVKARRLDFKSIAVYCIMDFV